MAIEIRETIVTPDANGSVVQLHISDVALGDEGGSFRLVLRAKLPAYETPLLMHCQREAMKKADDVLRALVQQMAAELNNHPEFSLNPTLQH
jgi:hypothetical protein